MCLGQIVGKLLLLNIGDSIDVLELSLTVPIFVEQIVVASQLLGHLSNEMEVLLGQKSRDIDITVLLVKNLDPNESLSRHDSFHKSKVKAPDHNNTQNDCQRSHDDPILNVVNTEDRRVNTIINTIAVFIIASSRLVEISRVSISVVLLQKRIQQ